MNGRTMDVALQIIIFHACVISAGVSSSEHRCSSPSNLAMLMLSDMRDISIKMTAREYDFTWLVWPQIGVNVRHKITISPVDPMSPPLLKFGVLFSMVVVHPGSELKLENMVLDYDRSMAMQFTILGFFKIKPGAAASIVNTTIFFQECESSNFRFMRDIISRRAVAMDKPIEKYNHSIHIEYGRILNADGQGEWIAENLTYRCKEYFDFDLLRPPAAYGKTVMPMTTPELALELLDKANRYFEIRTSLNLDSAAWPSSGVLFESNTTFRGPTGAEGWSRPILTIGDRAPVWEVRKATLEIRNLILEFSAPYPEAVKSNENIVRRRTRSGLENSTFDFDRVILPVACVTNWQGVQVLQNVRLRYKECPPGSLDSAFAVLNASDSSRGCTLDVLEDGREILFIPRTTFFKYTPANSVAGRVEITDVEFECEENTSYQVAEQENVYENMPEVHPKARKASRSDSPFSSDYMRVESSLHVKLLCLIAVLVLAMLQLIL